MKLPGKKFKYLKNYDIQQNFGPSGPA